jgi:orotidine-5'-phosphate decarboxylase
MGKDVIVALDFPTAADTLAFLDKFTGRKPYVKIGMELFYAEGPEIVREIKNRGHKIFLDLKLHDIPNTVEKAMKSLSKLSIDMVNVHAAGTIEMMEAAKRGLKGDSEEGPLLIAVTQLTSTSQERMNEELLIYGKLEDVVIKYAQNAKKAGLDGVVCSPLESGMIHDACGDDFVTVTPGVRFADSAKDDQVRITTPEGAKKLGSDYIVVGRPITKAEDPVGAYERCLAEFTGEEK